MHQSKNLKLFSCRHWYNRAEKATGTFNIIINALKIDRKKTNPVITIKHC